MRTIRKRKKHFLFLIIYLSCCSKSFEQENQITKEDLIKDIEFYVNLIDEAHGDPCRIVSQSEFQNKAQELRNKIRNLKTGLISPIDCFYHIQELAAYLQDGHTRVNFPYKNMKDSERVLPFKTKVINDKIYITDTWGKNDDLLLTELLEINGTPIKSLYDKSTIFFPTKRKFYQNLLFERFFPLYLTTYFELKPPYSITYDKNGNVKNP